MLFCMSLPTRELLRGSAVLGMSIPVRVLSLGVAVLFCMSLPVRERSCAGLPCLCMSIPVQVRYALVLRPCICLPTKTHERSCVGLPCCGMSGPTCVCRVMMRSTPTCTPPQVTLSFWTRRLGVRADPSLYTCIYIGLLGGLGAFQTCDKMTFLV